MLSSADSPTRAAPSACRPARRRCLTRGWVGQSRPATPQSCFSNPLDMSCQLCDQPCGGGGGGGGGVGLLTAGCGHQFHEKCIARYCGEQSTRTPGRELCPVCAAPVKKLVADQVTNDGARMEARRIKYGRQDYHLFVRTRGRDYSWQIFPAMSYTL